MNDCVALPNSLFFFTPTIVPNREKKTKTESNCDNSTKKKKKVKTKKKKTIKE